MLINKLSLLIKLAVEILLFLGGYGFVFIAQDTKTGKEYALKVLLFDQFISFLIIY